MSLAERLTIIKRETSLTGTKLGQLAGVSKSAISKIMVGKSHNLKLDHLFKLSDGTGYSAEWIAIGRGNKKITTGSGKKLTTPKDFIIDLTDYSPENRELIQDMISHIPKCK